MTTNNFSRRTFLKISGFGALSLSTTMAQSKRSRELMLYVGTYTSGKSEGIYIYRFNSTTGELTKSGSIKSENPSFLALDPAKRFLYAVNENPTGTVSSFRIDPKSAELTFLNQQSSGGADPCYLSVDRKARSLLVANYTSGNVSVLPILRDGSLGSTIEVEQHHGAGPREQQKGPHAHCIRLDRLNRHALAADLGIDKLMIYRFGAGKLGDAQEAPLHPGAGPRHLTFHPNGKYVYVINELDSSLTTFKYDALKGTLQQFEAVSTLPRDFVGTSYCADIHISRSGRFIYGSNRGHNSIVVFAVDARTGRLNLVEHVSTEGNWPRNFTLDPSEKFLLVANQRSDNVVTFRVDAATGRLTPAGQQAEIPVPVCLQFL